MNVKISELMDYLEDDSVNFEIKNIASADKVMEATMDKINEAAPPAKVAKKVHKLRRMIAVAAIMLVMLTATAFAIKIFSSLSGDDLSIAATYLGDGIIAVEVENRSDKDLTFQPSLKLMRWRTGEEIAPSSGEIVFDGRKISAGTTGTMTIDLSAAYDTKLLEEPLKDDYYYLVLTNNNFIFGQDWMCSVFFAESITTAPAPISPALPDGETIENIEERFQFYFEEITFDIDARRALNEQYIAACKELFSELDANIVEPCSAPLFVDTESPDVIYDDTVPKDEQMFLIGLHRHSADMNFKMLSSDTASEALVISAALPLSQYEDTLTYLPLFYIFTYDKSEIISAQDYIFVYGQLLQLSELEDYKVYEDTDYVCYELGSFIYSDLDEHTRNLVRQNPDVVFSEQVQLRIENIYAYYKENLANLFYYR